MTGGGDGLVSARGHGGGGRRTSLNSGALICGRV